MLQHVKEFTDYIELSGFKKVVTKNLVGYHSWDKAIVFYPNDIVEFEFHDEGDETKKAGWHTVFSFTGFSQLTFFKFSLLCHIVGVINLKENFKKLKS